MFLKIYGVWKFGNHYVISIQMDLKHSIIKLWKSANEIERELNYSHVSICNCCNGKYKTAYGYKWKYKKETA